VKERRLEEEPATVLETTKQAGEVGARWAWTEPTVWTERMLTALERGVKGGQWFSLIDKVYNPGNLEAAFEQVRRNAGAGGVDRESIDRFEKNRRGNLADIGEQLRNERYQPQAVRRVWIEKVGSKEKRPLGIPTVRDRVVQTALRNVLEPIFERDFAEQSYGFRPKRSAKDALRRVVQLLEEGHSYVVDADIQSYYDTIPREALMKQVERKISDGRVLGLVRDMLNQSVMEGLQEWEPEEGTPQGAVISPLLSNIYLDELDQHMVRSGQQMVRYADDCAPRALVA
jgi:RNA-directed DNA polymerase